MAKVTTIRCSASNGTDKLSIETDVSVTTKGIFSTTLKPSDVSRINQYGLRLKPNRLGNEGYFESDTLAGLEHNIKAFLDECISRERIEQKEVIKYRIRTNCHYVQSDREDGFAIYPNGTWLPKRLQDPCGNSCNRWVEGTEGRCQQNSPFRLSLYVGVFTRTVYRYASGRTVTEYEPCFSGHGRTSVDYLKGTVHMGLSDNAFGSMSMSEFRREIIPLPEVDATEENARVFVDILQFICRANGLLKQLADPGNIQAYIEQHAKLSIRYPVNKDTGSQTDKTTLEKLVNLRSRAFDMANSGKYGEYPFDETFNAEVEKGFSDDGTSWTSKDGTNITI